MQELDKKKKEDKLKKAELEAEKLKLLAEKNAKAGAKGDAMVRFKNLPEDPIVETPPKEESRRFNEYDIYGNYERDDKGNFIIVEPDSNGKYLDKDGKETN